MRRFLYQHPVDDRAKSVTPTLSVGAVDANYPLANLANDNPALPTKCTGVAATLNYDLGSALLVELIVFLHWNVRTPATVTVLADSVNTFDSGDLVTDVVDLTTVRLNGYWPYPFLDRSARPARRYLRIVIANNPSNLVIGGIWLGATLRSFLDPFGRGVQRPTGQEDVTLRTAFDVEHSFSRAPRGGIANAAMMLDVPDEIQQLQDFGDSCRWGARPVPVVFDDAVNAAQFVKWNQPAIVPELQTAIIASVPVSFRDISPGEAWD